MYSVFLQKFTFQYVSIISSNKSQTYSKWLYLHSNMFLLFRTVLKQNSRLSVIYIPICFYYFRPSSGTEKCRNEIYIPICFYYFLFCRLLKSVLCDIYIPICFYYFYVIVKELCVSARIYIPICFYYFESKVR